MKILLSILLNLCFQSLLFSQGIMNDRKETKVVVKTGTYIGIQSGRFYVGELGLERQRVRSSKWLTSNTSAWHMGLNYTYDFTHLNPILGADIGYWRREGALGFTYGLNACYRTNFDQFRAGICPTIGIKILQFHLQTGYHLLLPLNTNYSTFDTNTLFLSARFLLVKRKERK